MDLGTTIFLTNWKAAVAFMSLFLQNNGQREIKHMKMIMMLTMTTKLMMTATSWLLIFLDLKRWLDMNDRWPWCMLDTVITLRTMATIAEATGHWIQYYWLKKIGKLYCDTKNLEVDINNIYIYIYIYIYIWGTYIIMFQTFDNILISISLNETCVG